MHVQIHKDMYSNIRGLIRDPVSPAMYTCIWREVIWVVVVVVVEEEEEEEEEEEGEEGQ